MWVCSAQQCNEATSLSRSSRCCHSTKKRMECCIVSLLERDSNQVNCYSSRLLNKYWEVVFFLCTSLVNSLIAIISQKKLSMHQHPLWKEKPLKYMVCRNVSVFFKNMKRFKNKVNIQIQSEAILLYFLTYQISLAHRDMVYFTACRKVSFSPPQFQTMISYKDWKLMEIILV